MKISLEALIPVILSVTLPANTAKADDRCDERMAVIGNSHIVAMEKYARQKNIDLGNLVLSDTDPKTSQRMGCKRCDAFAYEGRNIANIRKELPSIIAEMDKQGIDRAMIYEGTNSAYLTGSQIRNILSDIVAEMHRNDKEVYLVEMPLGVAGSTRPLTRDKVRGYNKILHEVGADKVIAASEVPWNRRKVHGYTKNTFPYLIDKFNYTNDSSCMYAKINKEYLKK